MAFTYKNADTSLKTLGRAIRMDYETWLQRDKYGAVVFQFRGVDIIAITQDEVYTLCVSSQVYKGFMHQINLWGPVEVFETYDGTAMAWLARTRNMGDVRFFDGMMFDAEGNLLNPKG